ncbi:MAG: MotB family protein [Hyphomicrobiaceae bacterium]
MSVEGEEATLQELVIIRRRGGDEEGAHHGGVWKIAYADFMTAMMAFFLVMWLINATDKKVLTQVATYFNPLRLTDKSPTPRGLHDADTGAPGSENAPGQSKVKDGQAKGAKLSPAQQKIVEDALFKDPYAALEILAQQAPGGPEDQRRTSTGPAKPAITARTPGEAFRDPFDPEVRQSQAREPVDATQTSSEDAQPTTSGNAISDPATGLDLVGQKLPGQDGGQAVLADASAHDQGKAPNVTDIVQKALAEATDKAAQEVKGARDAKEAIERAEAAKVDAEIRQAMGQLGQAAGPDIEVNVTEDGLLISLTDKFDFGMFAIASAEPRPAVVAIMERIAKVLQTRPGQLIVRGHTDGRPFRSSTYDNWRLSTARAHMAYYMLVRGGLDEKRFERVEGHADRNLRVPTDPEAAQNRRIELLLRKPKS